MTKYYQCRKTVLLKNILLYSWRDSSLYQFSIALKKLRWAWQHTMKLIYYVIVPVGQKYRDGLVGLSCLGSQKEMCKCWLGLQSHLRSGPFLQSPVVISRTHSLQLYNSWKLSSPRPAGERTSVCCFQSLTSWSLLKILPDQVRSIHNNLLLS